MAMEDFKLRGKIVLDGSDFQKGLGQLERNSGVSIGNINTNLAGVVTAAGLAVKAIELLVTSMKGAVTEYMNLDAAMSKVNTLLDTQRVSSAMLRNDLLKVASNTGIWADELAEASYQALSAGVETERLSGFIEDMAVMSQAGFTSITSAVEVTTQIMNAYGKEVYSATEVSDKLIQTQNRGVTTVDQLSKSLYNVVPAAASLGISLDEVLAGIAVLTKNGVPTAQATTQMRQALLDLSDEATGAGQAFKSLTGETFLDFIKRGGSVAEAFRAMGEGAEKAGVPVLQLFSRIEGGQAGLVLAKGNAEEFREEVARLGESAGLTEKTHKIATDNIKMHWQKMKVEMSNSTQQFLADNEELIRVSLEALTGFVKNTSFVFSTTLTFLSGTLKTFWNAVTFDIDGAATSANDMFAKLKKQWQEWDDVTSGTTAKKAPVPEVPDPVYPPGETPTLSTNGSVIPEKTPAKTDTKQAERLARELELKEMRDYYNSRDILETEFNATQLQNDIEFFNQMSALRENHWYDENDFAQMQQDYEYNQFLEEQQFRLEQLEADKAFYEGKEEYAVQYAETLAKIKELELNNLSASIDREQELKNRDLTFTDKVSKSKEQLIKGAYSTLVSTNDNMLKALGKFFTDSIGNMMMAHGAELLYTGIKDVAKGIALSANPMTPGAGAALIAAGNNEIAQSALFAVGAGAMKAVGSTMDSGSSSSSNSSSVTNYTETTAEAENTIGSLEADRNMKIYIDNDDVLGALWDALEQSAKDNFNVEVIRR